MAAARQKPSASYQANVDGSGTEVTTTDQLSMPLVRVSVAPVDELPDTYPNCITPAADEKSGCAGPLPANSWKPMEVKASCSKCVLISRTDRQFEAAK